NILEIEKSFARQASRRAPRRRRTARAFTRVDFTVQGEIPPLRQHGPMTCWATVTTMLMSWRDSVSYDTRLAMGQLGARWQQLYDRGISPGSRDGLPASQKEAFLRAAGLVAE